MKVHPGIQIVFECNRQLYKESHPEGLFGAVSAGLSLVAGMAILPTHAAVVLRRLVSETAAASTVNRCL